MGVAVVVVVMVVVRERGREGRGREARMPPVTRVEGRREVGREGGRIRGRAHVRRWVIVLGILAKLVVIVLYVKGTGGMEYESMEWNMRESGMEYERVWNGI